MEAVWTIRQAPKDFIQSAGKRHNDSSEFKNLVSRLIFLLPSRYRHDMVTNKARSNWLSCKAADLFKGSA